MIFEEERRRLEEERQAPIIRQIEKATNEKVLYFDENSNRALIISKDIVAKMPYHKPGGDVTWEKCTLRKWLNKVYYKSLPPNIKSHILEETRINPDNEYGIPGGKYTSDKVFLLDVYEVYYRFKDDSSRVATFQGETAWWWLSSPGYDSGYATIVGHDGSVGDVGCRVHVSYGVRPAFWLNLDSYMSELS